MADDANQDDFETGLKPLWLRAQSGDDDAYRQALERIAVRLRGYLRRRMQTLPDEVEDLVQETLLALHLQRGTQDPSVPVSAWVLAVARYKLVDRWRRRGRHDALHEPLDETHEAAFDPADAAEQDVVRRRAPRAGDAPPLAVLQPFDAIEPAAAENADDDGIARPDHASPPYDLTAHTSVRPSARRT